jgi:transcriptional regulator with XRE-family HTH domain
VAGKKSDLGPTGVNLTHAVRRLRGNLSYNELSRRLADIGRDIPPLGLRRIEAGTRRVDVDDLMALAVVLGVSPIKLLMPDGTDPYASVDATGAGTRPACQLWNWLVTDEPLKGSEVEFWLASWPRWLHPAIGAEIQERKQRLKAELARRSERAAKRKADNGDS